jgi:single-strand DNA-binding protein
MAGINKVLLIGRLGADPEIRYTNSGAPVANFRIATSETWTSKEGKKEEKTEWHKIVAWGKLGELCGEYLSKGRRVFIEGKIQTRSWDDKNGEKKYMTEIIAQTVQFLDGPSKKAESGVQAAELPPDLDSEIPQATHTDDDIPF